MKVLGPGSTWTKVKKKGRRAPGMLQEEPTSLHLHSLTPEGKHPQEDLQDVLFAMRCASVDRETRNARKRQRKARAA